MEITYLGHSSFRIKGRGAVVVTDPFDPAMVGLKFPKVEADIVTVSHDHQDHNQINLVQGAKKVIAGPGEYEVLGVSIIGLATYHDRKQGQERGKNTIYVLEMDGLRLAHLGDLGHPLSEAEINQIGDIDILMIPVGGEFTIGAKEATEVARAIEPHFVLPMHFQAPGLNPQTFAALAPVDAYLADCGLKVERLPKLSVKEGELGEETEEVILLEKR